MTKKEVTSGTDGQNGLLKNSKDTTKGSGLSAEQQHLIIWGKPSVDVAITQTKQAHFQRTWSKTVAGWIEKGVIPLSSSSSKADIGKSHVDERWEWLNEFAPPPEREFLRINPFIIDDPQSYRPATDTLASDPATWKEQVDHHKSNIDSVYERLGSENPDPERIIGDALDNVSYALGKLTNETHHTEVFKMFMDVNLKTIHQVAVTRTAGDLKTTTDAFLQELGIIPNSNQEGAS